MQNGATLANGATAKPGDDDDGDCVVKEYDEEQNSVVITL